MRRRTFLALPGVAVQEGIAPLHPSAITEDWPCFLGPSHNGISRETRLAKSFPPQGPRLVWAFEKGSGYSSPAVAQGRLVFFHRQGGEERVVCLDPETGQEFWRHGYPSAYEDRYGYNDGPRGSPVIDGGRVYTLGAEGRLHCLRLDTGKVIWHADLRSLYSVKQDFFGVSSTPLVEGELVIINPGAPGGPTVAALDKLTGKPRWGAGNEWGPSYASPIPAVVHGKRRIFVFAGGESQPPTGGLLSVDPATGRIDFSFPWRSRSYESVNASCPVIEGNRVFISASYRTGGAMLEITPEFRPKLLWTTQEFGLHFNTPVWMDGCLYGFDGRNEPDASLACLDAATGKIRWRTKLEWTERFEWNGQTREQSMSPYRGNLLWADGKFLCLGEFGHLLWLDLSPSGVRAISRAWLFAARETWSPPVLSKGLLYVVQHAKDFLRQTRPRLLCYNLRA
jgi:outer membrane protein assembly factor BamB